MKPLDTLIVWIMPKAILWVSILLEGQYLGPALLTFGLVLVLSLSYYAWKKCDGTHAERCRILARLFYVLILLIICHWFFSDITR